MWPFSSKRKNLQEILNMVKEGKIYNFTELEDQTREALRPHLYDLNWLLKNHTLIWSESIAHEAIMSIFKAESDVIKLISMKLNIISEIAGYEQECDDWIKKVFPEWWKPFKSVVTTNIDIMLHLYNYSPLGLRNEIQNQIENILMKEQISDHLVHILQTNPKISLRNLLEKRIFDLEINSHNWHHMYDNDWEKLIAYHHTTPCEELKGKIRGVIIEKLKTTPLDKLPIEIIKRWYIAKAYPASDSIIFHYLKSAAKRYSEATRGINALMTLYSKPNTPEEIQCIYFDRIVELFKELTIERCERRLKSDKIPEEIKSAVLSQGQRTSFDHLHRNKN